MKICYISILLNNQYLQITICSKKTYTHRADTLVFDGVTLDDRSADVILGDGTSEVLVALFGVDDVDLSEPELVV